jgi:hypothetical protein
MPTAPKQASNAGQDTPNKKATPEGGLLLSK